MAKKNYQDTYFQHDRYARRDSKIKALLTYFRKESEEKAKAAICVFWWIVEDMHLDDYPVDKLEVFADDYRCDVNFLHSILNDFNLFRVENNCYVSDRVLRNLEEQAKKAEQKSIAANTKWLLSDFKKYYIEFFGKAPVLNPEEIDNLKKYADKIPDLREKLRDVLYTLSTLKFDTKIKFVPGANWLLTDNNLGRLLNGEFGPLKHKKTAKELREEQAKEQAEQEAENANVFDLDTISSKAAAIQYISNNNKDLKLMIPDHKKLMRKFDITLQEIKSFREDENA